jgi:hypothetical protein
MNADERIEKCLRAAPKPAAPDGLLDKLQQDVVGRESGACGNKLRKWFAPSGGRISLRRVAAAAVIAIAVLLPLSYGAAKVVERYRIEVWTVVDENGEVSKKYRRTRPFPAEVDSEKAALAAEIAELRKAGKYEKTLVGKPPIQVRSSTTGEDVTDEYYVYRYSFTLANGETIELNNIEKAPEEEEEKQEP